MKLALGALLLLTQCSCTSSGIVEHRGGDLIRLDSFALAARYGTPANYQRQGDHLQLNYGSTSAGCRVIVQIVPRQRVVGQQDTAPLHAARLCGREAGGLGGTGRAVSDSANASIIDELRHYTESIIIIFPTYLERTCQLSRQLAVLSPSSGLRSSIL